jgi:protein arginine kinase
MPSWLTHQGPDSDVVISTSIGLARNCAHHRFPVHASADERTATFSEVLTAFSRSGLRDSFNFVNFNNLDKTQQQFMVEERCATRDLTAAKGDRGVMHDGSRRISIMVNGKDHIMMRCIDAGCRPNDLWTEVDGIDDAVGMQLEYAFDERRGFLTSHPADAGTGLRVSFLMHMPGLALTRGIGPVLDRASRTGLVATGFFDERLSAAAGCIYLLSNSAAMGKGESEFCDRAYIAARRIIDHERKARESILADARSELADSIGSNFGVLCNSALLQMEEFLNLSSVLRLGIECTLFDKCTIQDLNRLTLFALPAHLQTFLNKDLDDGEIPRARAGLVKSFFAHGTKKEGIVTL